jgi:hypothetical protein
MGLMLKVFYDHLRLSVMSKPFQPGLMFTSKARVFISVKVLYSRVSSWSYPQNEARLERLARDKHSSSL